MSKYKKPLILITYGLLLYFLLLKFDTIKLSFSNLYDVISPFVWGFALAYLLNIPYTYLLNDVFKTSPKDVNYKGKKAIAITISYVLALALVVCISAILIPQLLDSINTFINNFSSYYVRFEAFFAQYDQKLKLDPALWSKISETVMGYSNEIMSMLQNLIPSIINLATSTATGIVNMIFTIIISIYFLTSKETLIDLINNSTKAFAKPATTKRLKYIVDLSNETFKGFFSSRLVDSFIVGLITFVGALIFNFPYTLLISVIAGITNIIPVIGPFIGAVPCIFIILMADPMKALWYLLFVLVLQQIDGNIIGPKVTSNSIGLDGIWVMLAILVGGGLFGVIGALLSVPIFAIAFKLYEEYIEKRLKEKKTTT